MKRCYGSRFTRRDFVRAAALLGGGSALVAGCAKGSKAAQGADEPLLPPERPPAGPPPGGRRGGSPWGALNLERTDGRETVARAVARAGSAAEGGPRVAVARSPRLWTDDEGVNPEVLATVVDSALMWFTGTDSAEKAWGSLFSSDEKIGLKPNGLGGFELSTAQQLSAYVVERLTGIGVKASNIVAWELNPGFIANCGIPVDSPPWGIRAVIVGQTLGRRITHGTIDQPLTRVVTEEVDAIVNLPILKDHTMAGVTLAMKNHYGTVGNPQALHGNFRDNIADLAAVPAIKDKTRLILCDMTHCVVEGGPMGVPHFFPGAIMVAADMVAHDAVGSAIIEEERKERGLPALAEVGRPTTYLEAAQERGVGVAELARIEAKLMDYA